MTIGERAEDVFYITGTDGLPLNGDACDRVKDSLMRSLDRRESQRS